jgi:hypothetical protein
MENHLFLPQQDLTSSSSRPELVLPHQLAAFIDPLSQSGRSERPSKQSGVPCCGSYRPFNPEEFRFVPFDEDRGKKSRDLSWIMKETFQLTS